MKFQIKDAKQTKETESGYITLQQLLKACNIIESGGQVKAWLAENSVLVNGEPENRRGKKLRPGDTDRKSVV